MFPIISLSNYHRLSSLHHKNSFVYSSLGMKSNVGIIGLKSRGLQAIFLSSGSRRETISYVYPDVSD